MPRMQVAYWNYCSPWCYIRLVEINAWVSCEPILRTELTKKERPHGNRSEVPISPQQQQPS